MKIKLRQLVESETYLNEIKMYLMEDELSDALFQVLRLVRPELQDYKERKEILIQQYALKKEDGSLATFPNGQIVFSKQQEAEKRHDELLAKEIDLKIKKLPKLILAGKNTSADLKEKLEWLIQYDELAKPVDSVAQKIVDKKKKK